MEQVITIRRRASPQGLSERKLGRITRTYVPENEKVDCFFVASRDTVPEQLLGYAGILVEKGIDFERVDTVPVMTGYETLSDLSDGTIVAIEPTGGTNTLYRPGSDHNAIFATGRCNNNCIMCSQPPSDWGGDIDEHLRLIDLINEPPSNLGISGGEPTLLGSDLTRIFQALKTKFPEVPLFMLSNGRNFANPAYTKEIAEALPCKFVCGIPLYADVAAIHDFVVQSKGAFEETMAGLYNCARYRIPVEIRVVIHKQTLPRLVSLAEFIYRNLPFVGHIALMGLENMGYVKKNWDLLWVDPVDYQKELEEAVKALHYRGMTVSIYNHPLCIIPHSLWSFARQSISDFKNLYLDECTLCSAKDRCSGLFQSSEKDHSRGIKAIQ